MFARELKKVIERWQFWGTVIFMVAAVIVNQLITCAQWWGKAVTYMRGAYNYTAINNVRSNITQLYSRIFCLYWHVCWQQTYYTKNAAVVYPM